eukprot:m.123162 g.123162  ORF g.123162 m.123162 type:complete len:719 (+) comp9402_c0_seq1:90-2246(+)
MYGLTHQALTRWMRSLPDGEEILERVLERCNIEGSADDFFRCYTDQETMGLLPIVEEETRYDAEEIMFEAGLMAMQTFIENGFEPALRTLGDNLFDLLSNLDSLHDNFLASFPKMKAPSIRPVRNSDDSLSIHYFSSRDQLSPFFMGMVKSCALVMFDLEIDIHHRIKKGKQGDHDVFHVFLDPLRGFPVVQHGDLQLGREMSTISLGRKLTSTLFPWHFVLNRDLKVASLGKNLGARLKKESLGMEWKKLFKLLAPVMRDVTFASLLEMRDKPFVFATNEKMMMSSDEYNERLVEEASRMAEAFENVSMVDGPLYATDDDDASIISSQAPSMLASARTSARSSVDVMDVRLRRLKNTSTMKLHGQIVHDEENESIIFVGNPPVKGLEELEKQSISLSDLPIHCHGREVLYSSMYQAVSTQNSSKIQEKLIELDSSMEEVNLKKEQIDTLLHSILPPVVAQSLARGRIPEAESYEKVSVLFSDIFGFTSISSGVASSEVMDMLHELFVKFDKLSENHGCYKVETIGDAYMVASGCPDKCDDHAERIAALAIDMVRAASTVISPLDGQPLKIRVGLHSGPLMAGVVGRARPRYCLFGDTVNVASRMESNGFPGCIQITYRFLRELPTPNPFVISPRGFINIKGKGAMKTFLLLGWVDSDDDPLLPKDIDDTELSASFLLASMNPRRFANTLRVEQLEDAESALSLATLREELLRRQSRW